MSHDLEIVGWYCWQFGHLISFEQSFPEWSGFFFHCILHISDVLCNLLCGWPYFWHLKHLKGAGMYCSHPLEIIFDFYFLGNFRLMKSQNVGVSLNFFSSPFLIVILLKFVTSCFPRVILISSTVAKVSSLLLITPFKVFNFSWG